jgi:AAA+ ATPase superfamily predicted ATPase
VAFRLTPATGSDFIGRRDLLSELVRELSSKNRIGFSLSGSRRMGKTSVMREVERQLTNRGIPVVYLSVWKVSPETVDQFVKVLNQTTVNAFENFLPSKFKFEELILAGAKALRRLLENLKLSANVGRDLEISVAYVRGEEKDLGQALAKSLSLAEDMSKMINKRSVLMLDEFPSLVDLTYGSKNQKLGSSIVKLTRTLYEDFKHTKLVISGSYRETMENVLTKQKSPFYRQLLLRDVKPFDDSEYSQFLKHYLPRLEFTVEARKYLYEVSSGIPYNLQLLTRQIDFKGTNALHLEDLIKICRDLLQDEGEMLFSEYVSNLRPSEIKVLRALARNPKAAPSEIASLEFMDGRTVSSSLTHLRRQGLVRSNGRASYDFTDNLFAEWLRMSDEESGQSYDQSRMKETATLNLKSLGSKGGPSIQRKNLSAATSRHSKQETHFPLIR